MGEVVSEEVLRRLEQLEGRAAAAERQSADLQEEVTRLRAEAVPAPSREKLAATDGLSRSQFLRMGAAAAAIGAVGAGGSLLGAGPAGAAQGNMQYGNDNNATDFTTRLRSVHLEQTLTVLNEGAQGKALVAETMNDTAVVGQVGTDAGLSALAAIAGAGAGFRNGVVGITEGGAGVLGKATAAGGYGVYGNSDHIDLFAGGRGRIMAGPRAHFGPPTTSESFSKGEQIRDKAGDLWLCVQDGTGAASVWRRAALVREGFAGGSVNVLPRPIRLYDSRSGVRLAAAATVDIQVTGTVVGGVSVPVGAVGVLGNITVTQTVAPSGYLTLYPQGSPPNPATSNVNWFATDQNLNAAFISALNPTNGKLTIHNGMAGGSNPTHAVLDITAFVF